jgi:hypothetical protein
METSGLEGIKQQLQQEQLEIRAKADKLRSELQAMDENLERIDTAIAALDGTASGSRPAKATAVKERKKITNPSAGKADVIKYMQEILAEKGKMAEGELKEAVESKLKEANYTLMGFSLRYKEAKGDARFLVSGDSVSMKDSSKGK